MAELLLHPFHESLGARFESVNGAEVVADYGNPSAEYASLTESAAIIDLSFRGRICLTGADRVRFLHGQITNDVNRLHSGEGCYTALITAKGRMESDLNVYALQDELLLDFEPGLNEKVSKRLEKYIIADDVQVVDVSRLYGLLSVQGPKSREVLLATELPKQLPEKPLAFIKLQDAGAGEIYLINQPRLSTVGFDLFIPTAFLQAIAAKLFEAARVVGGSLCGWHAFETARIEAGIPRFSVDMDDTNIPIECGIESRAISYNKGCYIGQEVINRIHTLGHVNKSLCTLRLADDLKNLPVKGDKLLRDEKEVGYVTSATHSSKFRGNIALGYVRREANQPDTQLILSSKEAESAAVVIKPIST